jgi:hypothetical protein
MTPVAASSHDAPAGEACFRRRINIAPTPPKARATPSIMPKTLHQQPPWRQNPDPDRRSNDYLIRHRSTYAGRGPGKSP